jgi:transposase InsO family protein
MPGLFSMPSNRPFISDNPDRAWFTTRIADRNICPFATPNDWPKQNRAIRRQCRATYDNAMAETINGLFKAEVIHRRGPWRSFDAVEYATLEWVDWFNSRRLLEPIGNIPPAEAEANFYAALETDQTWPRN